LPGIFNIFKKKEPIINSLSPVSFIIAGLGNPGEKYHLTRHNAGYLCIDYIAEKCGARLSRIKFKSLCGEARIEGARVLLLKPTTYMNNSGEAVREASLFYKIPPENIIVISDDINFEPGKMRIRREGSDGGQKGLRSITEHLGTDKFPRIRLGIGSKPNPEYDTADWVLSKFTESDKKAIFNVFENAYDSVAHIINGDIEGAMALYNKK